MTAERPVDLGYVPAHELEPGCLHSTRSSQLSAISLQFLLNFYTDVLTTCSQTTISFSPKRCTHKRTCVHTHSLSHSSHVDSYIRLLPM